MIEKKILFVDDEESQREIMEKILTKLGYKAVIADSSEAAIQIMEKESFPLIITDLSMPKMDGTKLCKLIRKENSKIVIYALSGFIETYKTEKLEAVGFDGYLSKPVSIDVLKQAIEGAFDKINRSNGNNNNKLP